MTTHLTDPAPSSLEPGLEPGLARALAELARLDVDQPLGQHVRCVADLAARALPGVDAISLLLLAGDTISAAAFTSPTAAMLDERQYQPEFGPSRDAATTGQVIRVDLTGADERYPAFARAAAHHGIHAATCLGLRHHQRPVGALTLLSRVGDHDEQTLQRAETFASYAAVTLANAARYTAAATLAAQQQEAMRSRAVIEQAKGVLMAIHRTGADEAFARLSTTSQSTNTKLRDLAADVVDRAQHGRPRPSAPTGTSGRAPR